MKRITFIICAAFFVAGCSNETKDTTASNSSDSSAAAGADKKATESTATTTAYTPPDSATAANNWMAYCKPGDVHSMLAKSNGTWTGTITMWMKPGAPPMTSTNTTVNKMIMGGRYQQSNVTGTMMGQPFEGMSIIGYDNAKKLFVGSWVDNMGTGLMKVEGPWDPATKTVTLKGKMVDPEAGNGREIDYKEEFVMVDDNNQIMKMYGVDPATGKEFQSMEIKLTRKK